MNESESWKPIPGYEGRYEASSLGRIKSFSRRRARVLTPYTTHLGRLKVFLCVDYSAKSFFVSRLVASAFLGPCPNGMECCHNNGIKTDNRAENLRWDTRENNNLDKLKHGGASVVRVQNIKMLIALGYSDAAIANIFNTPNVTISDIRRGKYWKNVAA